MSEEMTSTQESVYETWVGSQSVADFVAIIRQRAAENRRAIREEVADYVAQAAEQYHTLRTTPDHSEADGVEVLTEICVAKPALDVGNLADYLDANFPITEEAAR